MSLGAKEGDVIRISGSGAEALAAVEALRALAADGFGELPGS
jgi:phosphotransferase system HPr-like phosphotransfer protein